MGLLIFLTLPASGFFAWVYFLEYRRIMGGFRVRKLIRQKNSEFLHLKENYDELINLTGVI
jgi:hypothetical protein